MFILKLILTFFFSVFTFFLFQSNSVEVWLMFYFLVFWLNLVSYWNIMYLGKKGFFIINCLYLGFLSLFTNYIFFLVSNENLSTYFEFYSIYSIDDNNNVTLSLYLDFYNFSYINLTLTIGWGAYCYAYSYMRDEVMIERFLFLLLSFLYSMVFLLMANNFVMLILGWELIGITSYFLINFWVTKISTFKAAFKAFIFNRLSDVSLIVLLIMYTNFYNTLHLSNDVWLVNHKLFIFYEINNLVINGYDLMAFFCIIASACKSAQFGFHTWLPDSMEAPVPASALIHSATLVSAGVYLINKIWFVVALSNYLYYFFIFLSSWTSFYGAFVSLYQTDLKRILAYSTISHCGILMFLSILNNVYILIFYLYVHGFFKSLSFMCVGNIIKSSFNLQDYRYMGQKYQTHKFEYFFLLFSLTNLSGYGLSVGFFAKHLIIVNFSFFSFFYFVNFFFFIMTAVSGFFYSFFLINSVFFSFKKYSTLESISFSTSYTTTSPMSQVFIITFLATQSMILIMYIISFIYCSKFCELKINFISNFSTSNYLFIQNKYVFIHYLNFTVWCFFIIFFKFFFFRNFFFLSNYIFIYSFILLF